MMMMDNVMENVHNWEDETELSNYLEKIVRGEAADHSGLIYGMGHAVYTLSDPRAVILKDKARKMAGERDMLKKFELFERVEKLSPNAFAKVKGESKVISANVDFYSGLVYEMLGIPSDLFTPLFAISRISGWCAHRIEEMETCGRIMRPAYRSLSKNKIYVPINKRNEQ
jgi:citrate synthase